MKNTQEKFEDNLKTIKSNLDYSSNDGIFLKLFKWFLKWKLWDLLHLYFMNCCIKIYCKQQYGNRADDNTILFKLMDFYTLFTFILLTAIYLLSFYIPRYISNTYMFGIIIILFFLYPFYRIIEIFVISLSLHIRDVYKPSNYARALLLTFIAYFQIIIAFAIFYSLCFYATGDTFTKNIKDSSINSDLINPLYFSLVTITTLGYGDFSPQHYLSKMFVILQIILGLLFIVYILQKVVSSKNKSV